MADPSKVPNGKKSRCLPTEQDLIAFDHVAAGHEGITSNASGSLVIKPCTQAEIDFYESAKDHEHFRAHMPTYIGALTLNQDQSAADAVAPLLAQAGQPGSLHAAHRLSTSSLPPISELLGPLAPPGASPHTSITPAAAKRASWKPSGGKKLETGLAIVLENVAAAFTHPNILDVKLGARLWADDAPASKRRKLDEVSKETTSGSMGLRIVGMKMWIDKEQQPGATRTAGQDAHIEIKGGYKVYNRHYGRALTAATVKDGFAEYLGGVTVDRAGKKQLKRIRGKLIASRMIRELENMQYVLEHEESRMYSASILMVYEGDEQALEEALRDEEMRGMAEKENSARAEYGHQNIRRAEDGDDEDEEEEEGEEDGEEDGEEEGEEEEETPKVLDVRFIDFAHATWTPGLGPDENVLGGLRNVIHILRELVE
jgi:inositol-polyphosphate multikinase